MNEFGHYTFQFGKHKGQSIREVYNKDPAYFEWITEPRDPPTAAYRFVLERYPEIIDKCNGFFYNINHGIEKSEMTPNGYCLYCERKLVPIGTSRENGKSHDDWADRKYHKKCWRILQEEDEDEF
jgi:hypothetical protein